MKKVLLIEDDLDLYQLLKYNLERSGFQFTGANTGKGAVELCLNERPDLILLDILLPKLGGEQVLQALRQDPATARIPVIVFSSLSRSNSERLKQAGATAYIEKSQLDPAKNGEALVRLVNAALRPRKT